MKEKTEHYWRPVVKIDILRLTMQVNKHKLVTPESGEYSKNPLKLWYSVDFSMNLSSGTQRLRLIKTPSIPNPGTLLTWLRR